MKVAKKKTKKVTVDDLAVMIAKGFESTATKDDVKELGNRLDGVESRLEKVENNVLELDAKVESVDKRLKKIEEALEPLSLSYRIFQKEIQTMNSRIDLLEKKVGVS